MDWGTPFPRVSYIPASSQILFPHLQSGNKAPASLSGFASLGINRPHLTRIHQVERSGGFQKSHEKVRLLQAAL